MSLVPKLVPNLDQQIDRGDLIKMCPPAIAALCRVISRYVSNLTPDALATKEERGGCARKKACRVVEKEDRAAASASNRLTIVPLTAQLRQPCDPQRTDFPFGS
jgi:hypothetical protein